MRCGHCDHTALFRGIRTRQFQEQTNSYPCILSNVRMSPIENLGEYSGRIAIPTDIFCLFHFSESKKPVGAVVEGIPSLNKSNESRNNLPPLSANWPFTCFT